MRASRCSEASGLRSKLRRPIKETKPNPPRSRVLIVYCQPYERLPYRWFSDRYFFPIYRNFFVIFWLKKFKKNTRKILETKKHFKQNRRVEKNFKKKIGEQKIFKKNFFIQKNWRPKNLCKNQLKKLHQKNWGRKFFIQIIKNKEKRKKKQPAAGRRKRLPPGRRQAEADGATAD